MVYELLTTVSIKNLTCENDHLQQSRVYIVIKREQLLVAPLLSIPCFRDRTVKLQYYILLPALRGKKTKNKNQEYSCFPVLLVSSVQQSESAICRLIATHSWTPSPSSRSPIYPTHLAHHKSLLFVMNHPKEEALESSYSFFF